MTNSERPLTAGVVVIGDEILSGRTRDTNSGVIAAFLTAQGIDLCEVRVVADKIPAIVEAVNALRARYTYVLTTGGIGPTHDDVTADAIGAAFGVAVEEDARALAILATRYKRPEELTEGRRRMARLPLGASLIDNPLTQAPGFQIGNVFVLAGVPQIMEAMLHTLIPRLGSHTAVAARDIECPYGESVIAAPLKAIAEANPTVSIGSYPHFDGTRFLTRLVVRGRDQEALAKAEHALYDMLQSLAEKASPQISSSSKSTL